MKPLLVSPQCNSLRLTPWHAKRLAAWLDGVINCVSDKPGTVDRVVFLGKLQEAIWVSEWSREEVILDVTYDDVMELVRNVASSQTVDKTRQEVAFMLTEVMRRRQDCSESTSVVPRTDSMRNHGSISLETIGRLSE